MAGLLSDLMREKSVSAASTIVQPITNVAAPILDMIASGAGSASPNIPAPSAPVAIIALLALALVAGQRSRFQFSLQIPSSIPQTIPVPPG